MSGLRPFSRCVWGKIVRTFVQLDQVDEEELAGLVRRSWEQVRAKVAQDGGLTLGPLRFVPERVHLVQGGLFRRTPPLSSMRSIYLKPALELRIRAAQRDPPGRSPDDGPGLTTANSTSPSSSVIFGLVGSGELGAELADFLGDLVQDRFGRAPVEADARGAALQLLGAGEGGKGARHPVEHAARLLPGMFLCPLGRLDPLPIIVHRRPGSRH